MAEKDYKKVFERFGEENTFIKITERPPISAAQKSVLNRKGNVLFNSGDIEGARRIFITTGYSDGLTRIGDHYKSVGRNIEALRMYWIAPDKTKSAEIIMQLSVLLKDLIHTDEDKSND